MSDYPTETLVLQGFSGYSRRVEKPVLGIYDPTELQAAFARAKAWLDGLTPEEREAHFDAQKKSWVKAEMAFGDEGTRVVTP
jgi:hypothetical protein